MRKVVAISLALAALSLLAAGQARSAQPGELDSAFGTGGTVATAVGGGGTASALIVQPDGKLVAAGFATVGSTQEFALVRYGADGSLDPGFGSAGVVTTATGSGDAAASALVLQPDGKLVAVGSSSGSAEFALVRYRADGSLDTGFGIGGIVRKAVGASGAGAFAALRQADGKLVAAGYGRHGFAVVRYAADGTLDAGFGTGGIVTTSVGSSAWAVAQALAAQADGKLVAAGRAENGAVDAIALARWNADGSLDTSFGVAGTVKTPSGSGRSGAAARALVVQADGKLVTAGDDDGSFALLRYAVDGSLDASFGSSGIATAAGSGVARALALQPDGRLVAAGDASSWGGVSGFGLARYASAASTGGGGRSTFLCYSVFQVDPAVYPSGTAAELLASSTDRYFLPSALAGTVSGGTNVGGYHLVCNPGAALRPTGRYVDGGGDVHGQGWADAMQGVWGTSLNVFALLG